MKTNVVLTFSLCVLALASGCTTTTTSGGDTGGGNVDTGGGGLDSSSPPNDTGADTFPAGDTGIDAASATDSGSSTDAATIDTNPFYPDGAIMCLPGVECTNWAAAIGSAARDASNTTMAGAVANCVVQVHRSDCCGARTAYGVNHGSRTQLCTAESMCDAMYPATPGCSSDVITVDTGDTTTDPTHVRVHGVATTPCSAGACVRCETIVCDPADSTCSSLEGISTTQCG